MIRRKSDNTARTRFLSSNTQDFIEVMGNIRPLAGKGEFLSSNTQDFIEVIMWKWSPATVRIIPEL